MGSYVTGFYGPLSDRMCPEPFAGLLRCPGPVGSSYVLRFTKQGGLGERLLYAPSGHLPHFPARTTGVWVGDARLGEQRSVART